MTKAQEDHKQDSAGALKDAIEDYKDRIAHLDSYCNESIAVVEATVQKVSQMATQNVGQKEAELQQMVEFNVGRLS